MTSGCPRRPCWNTWIPRTEGNALLLDFHAGMVDGGNFQTPPLVFVFTSGYCGGPEWAERIAFNSKPIRMHFCCTPPISSLGRLSRTDDVTDCCEHCFHGNAYHRFGLHFRELSLHSPTPPPTSYTLHPLLATQAISPLA